MEKWKETAQNMERIYLAPIAIQEAKAANKKNPGQAFSFARELFESHSVSLRLVQFLTIKKKEFKKFLEKNKIEVSFLESQWETLCINLRESHNSTLLNEFPAPSQELFWESIEQMSSIKNLQISRKFEVLNEAFSKVLFLTNDKDKRLKLLRTWASIVVIPELPILFVLYNKYAMKNPEFRVLLKDEDLFLWTQFESFVLSSFANLQKDIIQKFLALQELPDD